MAGFLLGDAIRHEVHDKISHQNPGKSGGRWYLSRKEIEENSPSGGDGMDLKRETYLRKSYCTFLQDLGMRLKVPQVTIATAIIFCHRFFLCQSHVKNDRRTVATVCMFLAGKVEETPRPLKDVILVSYEIIHKKDPEAVQRIKQKEVYEQQKEMILLGERVVLTTLGFDLNVHHPYKPLVEAIKKFKVAQNALAQVAWNFVNDGLRTSLCLQFKPHHIAAGAIFLAAKFLKVKLPSDGEKVWWQEFDVTPRQLEEVSNQMLELYEQNRVPPSQTSEVVEGSAGEGLNQQTASKAPAANESHVASSTKNQGEVSQSKLGGTLNALSSRPTPDQASNSDHNPGPRCTPHDNGIAQHHIVDGEMNENLRSDTRDMYKGGKIGQSPQDAIKKIDKEKLKAALEKRKKTRVDVTRKMDLDDDDLIERELEDRIELATELEKTKQGRSHSWSKHSADGDHDHVEGGEMGAYEDGKRGYKSPKSNNRKRKLGDPA